jgi:hypothetical protein
MRTRRAGLVGVLVALTLAACATNTETSTRPIPPSSASPVSVVQAYLAAAKAQDCTFRKILTQPKATWNWCHDPRLLDYRSVGTANAVPAAEAGLDEQCVPFDIDTHGSSDGSMPTGWQPWSLCLVHTAAGWRVNDQGQG